MGKNLDMFVAKVTSARWLLAILFGTTACYGFLVDKVPAEAFLGLCAGVVTGYQLRNRPEESNGKPPTA